MLLLALPHAAAERLRVQLKLTRVGTYRVTPFLPRFLFWEFLLAPVRKRRGTPGSRTRRITAEYAQPLDHCPDPSGCDEEPSQERTTTRSKGQPVMPGPEEQRQVPPKADAGGGTDQPPRPLSPHRPPAHPPRAMESAGQRRSCLASCPSALYRRLSLAGVGYAVPGRSLVRGAVCSCKAAEQVAPCLTSGLVLLAEDPLPGLSPRFSTSPRLRGACRKLRRRRSAGGREIAAERTPADSGTLGRSLQVRACPSGHVGGCHSVSRGHLVIRVPLQRFSPCFSPSSHSASAEA